MTSSPPLRPETSSSSLEASLIDSSNPTIDEFELALKKLESFLKIIGFCQYTPLSTAISWIMFFIIGVIAPVLLIVYAFCSDCWKYQIRRFELEILISQAIVAAISLLCVSHNLRKYGVRKLLFVDHFDNYADLYRKLYIHKIYVSSSYQGLIA